MVYRMRAFLCCSCSSCAVTCCGAAHVRYREPAGSVDGNRKLHSCQSRVVRFREMRAADLPDVVRSLRVLGGPTGASTGDLPQNVPSRRGPTAITGSLSRESDGDPANCPRIARGPDEHAPRLAVAALRRMLTMWAQAQQPIDQCRGHHPVADHPTALASERTESTQHQLGHE